MNALGGTLLAACLALLAAAAAGQTTINSTEGTLAYVSRLGRVVWLPPLPPALPLPLPLAAGVAFASHRCQPPPHLQNGIGTGYTTVMITPSSGYGGAPLAMRIVLTVRRRGASRG